MMSMVSTLILRVDNDDRRSILEAVAMRERLGLIPDGGGNDDGRAIAEICRGWMEFMARA